MSEKRGSALPVEARKHLQSQLWKKLLQPPKQKREASNGNAAQNAA
ncbi:hypothetical protein BH23CHL4_BH23CHL4_25670 [soil metagenome]